MIEVLLKSCNDAPADTLILSWAACGALGATGLCPAHRRAPLPECPGVHLCLQPSEAEVAAEGDLTRKLVEMADGRN